MGGSLGFSLEEWGNVGMCRSSSATFNFTTSNSGVCKKLSSYHLFYSSLSPLFQRQKWLMRGSLVGERTAAYPYLLNHVKSFSVIFSTKYLWYLRKKIDFFFFFLPNSLDFLSPTIFSLILEKVTSTLFLGSRGHHQGASEGVKIVHEWCNI